MQAAQRQEVNDGVSSPDGVSNPIEDLGELRTRLVRAQRAENAAVRKLSDVLSRNTLDKAAIKRLQYEVHIAREYAHAAYEAWNRAAQSQIGGEED